MSTSIRVDYPGKGAFAEVFRGHVDEYAASTWWSALLPHAVLCVVRLEYRTDLPDDPYLVVQHGGTLCTEDHVLFPYNVHEPMRLVLRPFDSITIGPNLARVLSTLYHQLPREPPSLSELVAQQFTR